MGKKKVTRRDSLKMLGGGGLGAFMMGTPGAEGIAGEPEPPDNQAAEEKRPPGNQKMNVLVIMTDQQRADSFGPGRHACANFPRMEKLASESVTFTRYYTVASPCVPSRYSFLTGRNSWARDCFGNSKFLMSDNETTWMSMLRDSGYRCVSVGKTHMVHAGSFHIQIRAGKSWDPLRGWNYVDVKATEERDEDYFDIAAARETCRALQRLKGTQPFALFLGFHAPHEPYVMPKKYLGFCKPENAPLPKARAADEYETKSEGYRRRRDLFKNRFGENTDAKTRQGIAGHHCLLKMVDDMLGQVLDEMKSLGLLENTLIVFTSDHGDVLGEHHIFNKAATFYEGETRIPMMIRFPDGRHRGKRLDHLGSNLDFFPTLLDILGEEADVSLPGKSLMPMIEKGEIVREHVTTATVNGMMIRTDKEKLWHDKSPDDGEMYDLNKDPMELTNLYHSPEHREMRRKLTEKMLLSRINDDNETARPTKRDKRLHQEIRSSYEPET